VLSLTRIVWARAQDPREGGQTVLRGGMSRLGGEISGEGQALSHPCFIRQTCHPSGLCVCVGNR